MQLMAWFYDTILSPLVALFINEGKNKPDFSPENKFFIRILYENSILKTIGCGTELSLQREEKPQPEKQLRRKKL
ncbi:MAG: hypothetical protein H8D56_00800 [Planctomycetes bacterium]|nr:hypothetical protein [Planctomycetota bacterium]